MEQIIRDGGLGGKTVYRDASGVKVDLKTKMMSEKDRLKQANEQQLKMWKGGAKQVADKADLNKAMEEAKD